MAINKDVIIFWPSTHASIPSGFVRETTLDDKFIKGTANAVEPNVLGGSSTHGHSSPSHSHSVVNHTHAIVLGGADHQDCRDKTTTGGGASGAGTHNHEGTIGGASGVTSSVAVTYGSISNEPPYSELIFMRSTTYKPVPNGAIVLFHGGSIPDGFVLCDGNSGTPNLRNKFIKGAGNGLDAGDTGGSSQNIHNITHGHSASHSHSGASGEPLGNWSTRNVDDGNFGGATPYNHTHAITLNGRSDTIVNYSSTVTGDETVEPAYTKLTAIKNTSGVNKLPGGIIGLWLGDLADIPIGWYLCDGNNSTPDMRSRYLKCSNTAGEAEDTGGSNTHSHAAKSHGHSVTGASHSHGGSVGSHPCGYNHLGGSECTWLCGSGNAHGLSSVANGTVSYANANTTANSSNNEPPHRTVAFIMYSYEAGSASMLINN